MSWYSDYSFGSASWASPSQIRRAGLYKSRGVFIGICPYTGKYLHIDSDAPITLFGGSGSGKGATLLLYNMFYPGSIFSLDPKGENGAISIDYHRLSGKDFWSINPSGLHKQSPWNLPQHKVNPFDILDPESPHLISDCQRISHMLIFSGKDKDFFPLRARQWMQFLLLAYVLSCKSLKKITLTGFIESINLIESDYKTWKSLAESVYSKLRNSDINRTVREIIERKESAYKEFSGVISTIVSDLNFMADTNLKTLFSGSDFSLSALSQTNPPAVINVAFPAENQIIHKNAMRLIMGIAILWQYRNHNTKPLFMLDEGAQLGYMEEIELSYTYGRNFYKTFGVFQDIGQLQHHYGSDGAQTIIGSSQTKIFIGVREPNTGKYVSEMLGNQTIMVENPTYSARARYERQRTLNNVILGGADPFQAGMELAHWNREIQHRDKMARPLMSPDEVINMPSDRSIVFISDKDVRPIPAIRKAYFLDKKIVRYFLPNPYFS